MDVPQFAQVTEDFALNLIKGACNLREQRRQSPSPKPGPIAWLFPDYHRCPVTNVPFYSVEFKPKWHGALHFLSDASKITPTLHHEFCRFCNHNYSLERVASGLPRYCPADLFSHTPKLIRHTIECLSQEPRNNFRVFQNGAPFQPHKLPVPVKAAVAKFLSTNEFLLQFSCLLRSKWKMVLQQYSKDRSKDPEWIRLLLEAVALRDCSFIVRCFSSDNFEIKLIDLERKSDSKLDYYIFEVEQMLKLLLNHAL